MKNTGFPTTDQNLIRVVREYASPATLALIASQWDDCPTAKRVDLVMESYATLEQKYIIVKIASSDTWGLIDNIEDDQGDVAEYLNLFNAGIVRHWHE